MRIARILLGLVVAFVGLAMLGLLALFMTQQTSYRIERTRVVTGNVRPYLSDLRAFESWDPWPSTTGVAPVITYSPVTSGVGAWVERRDRDGMGARTTIVSIESDRIVLDNTTFGGAFGGGTSHQSFQLRTVAGGTEVTWALWSDLHGLRRMLWPFVHLEARVQPEMEAALTRLDAVSR